MIGSGNMTLGPQFIIQEDYGKVQSARQHAIVASLLQGVEGVSSYEQAAPEKETIQVSFIQFYILQYILLVDDVMLLLPSHHSLPVVVVNAAVSTQKAYQSANLLVTIWLFIGENLIIK